MDFNASIPQSSVSQSSLETFLKGEKREVSAVSYPWMKKTEGFSQDQRQEGLIEANVTAWLTTKMIDNFARQGGDLVEIRKLAKMVANDINEHMQDKFQQTTSSTAEVGVSGINLFMDPEKLLHRAEKGRRQYGADLSQELSFLDEDGRRFAKAPQYDPHLLPGLDGDTRVYHCVPNLNGCLPIGNLTQKLPGEVKDEINNGNYTVCNYITHEETEVSPNYKKPVQGVAVGIDDPRVCTPLFLNADKK